MHELGTQFNDGDIMARPFDVTPAYERGFRIMAVLGWSVTYFSGLGLWTESMMMISTGTGTVVTQNRQTLSRL